MLKKKLIAAILACGMTASPMMTGRAVFAADEPTEPGLTFAFKSNAAYELTLTEKDLESDWTIPVEISVPSNPGVNGISLKLQVNDGQPDENGLLRNYGFKMSDAKFDSPYCFDSANAGDPSKAFQAIISKDAMNIGWIFREDQSVNADNSKEAGTTAWTDASHNEKQADLFAHVWFTVPKGTAVGDYVIDVRRDKYVNSYSVGKEKTIYGKSTCTQAGSDTALDFTTKPFTLHVIETPETTTTLPGTEEPIESTTVSTTTLAPVTTTTAEITTTLAPISTTSAEITTTLAPISTTSAEITTTLAPISTTSAEITTTLSPISTTSAEITTTLAPVSTTTDEITAITLAPVSTTTIETTTSAPAVPGELWQDDYSGRDKGFYLAMGDVCGKPGETVALPVYLFNAPDVAGMQLYFVRPANITLDSIDLDYDDLAFMVGGKPSPDTTPASFVFTSSDGKNMKAEGKVVCDLFVNIPADAKDGEVYAFDFYTSESKVQYPNSKHCRVCDEDGSFHDDVKYFGGTVTVVTDNTPRISKTAATLKTVGETADLTLFNVTGKTEDVKWTSSDEKVATVGQNGLVTAVGEGTAEITVETPNGKFTCKVTVGQRLWGDVDNSGTVDGIDALLVLKQYNCVEILDEDGILTPEEEKVADVDLNGKIEPMDGTWMLKYYSMRYLNEDEITWFDLIKKEGVPTELQGDVES